MLHLKVSLIFILRRTKNCKNNVKKKMHLTLQLMIHLTMQSHLNLKFGSLPFLYILYSTE